jgi:hypothetical protein
MEIVEMNPIQKIPWLEKATTIENGSPMWREHITPGRVNLYRIPWLRSLLKSRWPQFLVRVLALAGFVLAIAAGLFGSAVGGHNFAIIFVWIAWWTALKLAFIPFGGRSWCSICPIPLPGEWLQQGGILEKSARPHGLNLRWAKRLKGSWLQSISFLLIGLFSALTLTDPRVTGWVLLALFGLAIALSLVFERRAFCSYICPIGGFTGIYAQTAPVELRVIDTEICAKHGDKSCYHACPWGLYPVAFRDSAACGLCMECLRACPQDNLALNLRPFGTDIGKPRTGNRLDEAFLALVMLGSALTFAAVFVGPWGWLKSAAFAIGSLRWAGYAAGFLVINLLLLPGLFALATWAGQKYGGKKLLTKKLTLRREFANQSQALLPLGLTAWIAFTISFALPKLGYVVGVVNDPFGWGWNLLGTFDTSWSPDVSGFSPVLQLAILLIGLFWSAHVANRLAESNFRRAFPVIAFSLAFSLSMLWLLIG